MSNAKTLSPHPILRFWSADLPDLLASLKTDGSGLSVTDARQRLLRFGPNEVERVSRFGGFLTVLRRAINPLVLILLVASIVSAAVGELVNATIIALMVLFSTAIDVYQTHRSNDAAKRLRRRVETRATVLRDGLWTEVAARAVVPGDRIQLRSGDIVPADGRVLDATYLLLDESSFSGESLPIEKLPAATVESETPTGALNAVFMGTVVAGGSGEVLIVNTGGATAFAGIARSLQRAAPETAFDRGLRGFGLLIARTVFVLVIFVLIVNLIDRRTFLDSLLFAVALAVGLTPEFLPIIVSVTQAEGALKMARSKVIVRQLAAIQNLGNMDVICSDKTGTLTEGKMALSRALDPDGNESDSVRLLAYLNARFQTGIRSPFDEAITAMPVSGAESFRRLGELPFDFQRRRLSVLVESDDERLLITKGAPESVLAVCTSVATPGERLPLDGELRRRLTDLIDRLGAEGFRLLGVAARRLPDGQPVRPGDEAEMTFAGVTAFSDPAKPGIGEVLARLRGDGIRLLVLTGDAEAVTRHVCEEIGLPVDGIIVGEMLAALDDDGLGAELQRSSVFARVSPDQKLRIIRALQKQGHVVGYLGDGINDAPSLHAADVGISVAEAVDVARDAAQIVLLEKSLSVLHEGIVQGREVFGNVMKYIMMGTSSNFGNMLSMAGALLFLPFLPLLPSQLLVNNALYDIAQISIPTDTVDEAMVRKPRGWNMRFIRDFMLVFGPISSAYDFLTFFVLRHFFHADERLFHTGWFVESLATQALVIFVIRTTGSPFRSRPSLFLAATVILVVAIGAFLPWSPLGHTLGFDAPPAGFVAFVAGAVASYLVLVEVVKRVFFRLHPLF